MTNAHMTMTTLYLTKARLEQIDELVRQGFYPSRSEALRMFIRDGLDFHVECEKIRENGRRRKTGK